MRRRMKKTAMCALLLLLCGCVASHGPMEKRSGQENVAHVFATTAIRVFDVDHADFNIPIEEAFSTHDLAILGENRDALVSMIESALGWQDSVWGARLAGHFRVEKVLWLVRYHFLTPRRCYGWEGPDYSQLESFLTDNQYQYSITYLEAIEAITGKPIADAIVLTPAESTRIEKHAKNEKSVFYHWALWIQRKLNHLKAEQSAAADSHKPHH
jgi:hypothetical protein